MKEIQLTRGKVALVDDTDYGWLIQWKWHALKGKITYYAARRTPIGANGKSQYIYMHRAILGLGEGNGCDHKDRNGLNNQRNNLRECDQHQNNMNRISQRHTSEFKGVCMQKKCSRWRATINLNRERTHLGYYDTPEAAAIAYDHAAREMFGEFARTNF